MIQQMSGDDYGMIKVAVMAEVKTYFRPEFINRIDEVVVFHSLDEKHIAGIATHPARLSGKAPGAAGNGALRWTTAPWPNWRKAGFDPVFGARPLKRAIQQQIENPLAKAILEGKFAAKDTHQG